MGVVGTVLGWGLVTNSAAGWLDRQRYLLGPLGLSGRDGAWAGANLGVLVALVPACVAALIGTRSAVRAQEARTS
jgi:hypothetical protein